MTNILCPIIDRWSPLAYAIGDYVHTKVAKHAGYETCLRHSHSYVHIIQGYSLFHELGEDCALCRKKNGRFIEAAMGPVDAAKFTIAPAFWTSQCDLWGPMTVYVPGREKNTRNSTALSTKVWAMVTVCVVTKLVNIQVVESHEAQSLAEGITRLTCEVGTPANLLVDQDSALMKALREGDIELIDLETHCRRVTQMNFKLCPVGGHNAHGLVEAKIKVAQIGLDMSGAGKLRLHATGVQTLCKLIENDMNNTPYGVTAGRGETNTPLLKIVSPQMMRMGRINSRAPAGPFRLPSGPRNLLDRVEECYKLWFRHYQDTLLQKYLLDLQPKWFRSDVDTKVGDVVFFRKREGKMDGPWQLGQINEVTSSRDGVIRRVEIKYFNASEEAPRFTDRSVRQVIKLFHVDEGTWKDDMDQVAKLLDEVGISVNHRINQEAPRGGCPVTKNQTTRACGCCCSSHEVFCLHTPRPATLDVATAMTVMQAPKDLPLQLDTEEDTSLDIASNQLFQHRGGFFYDLVTLGTDLGLPCCH